MEMGDDDFLAIERSLREFAVALGSPEIMEDKYYRVQESGESPGFLTGPRQRVVAQIAALDRALSLRDRASYENAMGKIERLLVVGTEGSDPGPVPEGAVVVLEVRGGEDRLTFDLADLPDLGEVRERLRRLRSQLQEG